MIPIFNLFGKDISIYLIMGLVGVFVMMGFGLSVSKKTGLDDMQVLSMFCYSFIGIIAGGHIMYAVTQFDKIVALIRNFDKITGIRHLFSCLSVIFVGSVYY